MKFQVDKGDEVPTVFRSMRLASDSTQALHGQLATARQLVQTLWQAMPSLPPEPIKTAEGCQAYAAAVTPHAHTLTTLHTLPTLPTNKINSWACLNLCLPVLRAFVDSILSFVSVRTRPGPTTLHAHARTVVCMPCGCRYAVQLKPHRSCLIGLGPVRRCS